MSRAFRNESECDTSWETSSGSDSGSECEAEDVSLEEDNEVGLSVLCLSYIIGPLHPAFHQ